MDGDPEWGLWFQACDERGDRRDNRQGLEVVDLHIGRCLLWRNARTYQRQTRSVTTADIPTWFEREAFCVKFLEWHSGIRRKEKDIPVLIPHAGQPGWTVVDRPSNSKG